MKLGQYIPRASWFHSLDPRVKLLLITSMMVSTLLVRAHTYVLFLLSLLLILALTSGVLKEMIRATFKFLPLLLIASLIWALFYEQSLFYKQGTPLFYATLMPLRILVMIWAPTIFFMTTRMREFISALISLRIPYSFAFTFALASQLVFTLGEEFQRIKEAQMARGLELDKGWLLKRVKAHLPLLIPFIVSSLELAEQMGLALQLKGFDPRRKPRVELNPKPLDFLILFCSLILPILGVFGCWST